MERQGTIIVVDDDVDDLFIFKEILDNLNINATAITFTDAQQCYDYLCANEEEILMIFSDVNMPGVNGLEFKRRINNNPELYEKYIPFVFYSTAASKNHIEEAFKNLNVQGYFLKKTGYGDMQKSIENIVTYWSSMKYIDCAE